MAVGDANTLASIARRPPVPNGQVDNRDLAQMARKYRGLQDVLVAAGSAGYFVRRKRRR